MKIMKSIASFALGLALMGCQEGSENKSDLQSPEQSETVSLSQNGTGTIVDVARGAGSFKTLLSAAEAADLVGVLQSDGPFTVFAPTDEAFAALPAGVLDGLLRDKQVLKELLLYHVIAGQAVDAATAKTLSDAQMANGKSVVISLKNQDLFINQSKVIATDVLASNGTIHVIDKVLVPAGMEERMRPSLFSLVQDDDRFNILESYLKVSGLDKTLASSGQFTVFAPTNEAFLKLPVQTRLDLYWNTELLSTILQYHVVSKSYDARSVLAFKELVTVGGRSVRIDTHNLRINNAKLVQLDVKASNGFAHVIDTVLIPSH